MFAEEDRHIAYERYVGHHTPNDIFPFEKVLSARIQFRVIRYIIIPFGQELCLVPTRYASVSMPAQECPVVQAWSNQLTQSQTSSPRGAQSGCPCP